LRKIVNRMVMSMRLFLWGVLLLVLGACSQASKKGETSTKEVYPLFDLVEVWRTDTVLQTPESVLFDKKHDRLYVTNLNMEPRMKDGNGFVSILSRDGKVERLRWVEGMSSPKGMALVEDTLFVADVDELVLIDVVKGEIIRKIPVEGAKMLNDMVAGDQGVVYFTDTDAGKIHVYEKGMVSDWLTEGLNGPNGLLIDGGRLLVASQGGQDFAAVDLTTKEWILVADSVGRGDGIVATGLPGSFLVSDWEGEIFLIYPDQTKVSLLETKSLGSNTADLEFLQEEGVLLVPTFFGNTVVAYALREKPE